MKTLKVLIFLSLTATGALCQPFVPEMIYQIRTIRAPQHLERGFVSADGGITVIKLDYSFGLYDSITGEFKGSVPQEPTAPIAALSQETNRIATSSYDGLISIFDLTATRLFRERRFSTNGSTSPGIVFSTDGRFLYVFGANSWKWGLEEDSVSRISTHSFAFSEGQLASDGARLVYLNRDTVHLREINTMTLIGGFGNSTTPARGIRLIPDSPDVLVAYNQGASTGVQVRNRFMNRVVRDYPTVPGECTGFDMSPDGRWAVVRATVHANSGHHQLYAYDLESGEIVHIAGGVQSNVSLLGFALTNGRLYFVRSGAEPSFYLRIEAVDLTDLQFKRFGQLTVGIRKPLAYSPDSKFLMLGQSAFFSPPEPVLELVGTNNFKVERTYQRFGHTNIIKTGHFDDSGSRFYSGADDTTIKIWDLSSGLMARTLYDNLMFPLDIDVSPTTGHIAASFGSNLFHTTGVLKVWDGRTWEPLHVSTTPWRNEIGVHFNRYEPYLIAIRQSPNAIRWLRVSDYEVVRSLDLAGTPTCVAFSNKHYSIAIGFVLATPANGQVAHLALQNMGLGLGLEPTIVSLPAQSPSAVSFVPGSDFVAISVSSNYVGRDNLMLLFINLYTHVVREVLLELPAEPDTILFSPNGKQMAIYRKDDTLLVYRNPAFRVTGDANGDGCVSMIDFQVVVKELGQRGFMLDGDVNNDGRVDVDDLAIVMERLDDGC